MHHHQMPMNEVNRLFEAVILARIRYGISVYGCDEGALRKVDKFLEKCCDKKYCNQRSSVYDIDFLFIFLWLWKIGLLPERDQ